MVCLKKWSCKKKLLCIKVSIVHKKPIWLLLRGTIFAFFNHNSPVDSYNCIDQ